MAEKAIAWEPIPRDANHYRCVGVVRFEEQAVDEGLPVSIVVAATTGRTAQEQGGRAAWLIKFVTVAAFQRRLFGTWWPEARSITIPADHSKSSDRLEVAMWEIIRSPWLKESVPPNAYSGVIHHYVIADEAVVYEIAARGWMSEQLPPGWEQMYGV